GRDADHDPARGREQALPRRHGRRPAAGPVGAPGRDRLPGRPVGVRQDDHDEDGQPARGAHDRAHRAGRRGRDAGRPGAAAPPHRLRHPAGRPVPPPAGLGERRDRPVAARLGPGPAPVARRRAARAGRARARRLPRPLARAAVGRSTPARGRGPGTGRRPAGAAHGRAVLGDRPDRPRPAADRVPAGAGAGAQDDPVRHPRHRRGGPARRPDRRLPPGRGARAVRRPRDGPRRARHPVRGRLRRGGPRAAAARGHRHRHRRARQAPGRRRRRLAGRGPHHPGRRRGPLRAGARRRHAAARLRRRRPAGRRGQRRRPGPAPAGGGVRRRDAQGGDGRAAAARRRLGGGARAGHRPLPRRAHPVLAARRAAPLRRRRHGRKV
ncbi:MAG: ABC transporter, ATP-binding protein (cluster 13, osmolytes), partial [uncultured Frankineae bacterium]